MKKKRNRSKTTAWGLTLLLLITLTACSNKNNSPNSTFPNIDDDDLPDVLQITVETPYNTSFTTGITDADYNSVLSLVFNDTTEADYTALMEHYKSSSTGTDENGFLLFDWGRLLAEDDHNSINVLAFIYE